MDLIIQLGWLGGARLVGDDSWMAEGLPPCTHTHTRTGKHNHAPLVLSMFACRLAAVANAGTYSFHSRPYDINSRADSYTHVCLQAIQTQWTLAAQLAIRQKGKRRRAEGGTDEKWNLSSYCLSPVISPSPPSLYFFLFLCSPSPICHMFGGRRQPPVRPWR